MFKGPLPLLVNHRKLVGEKARLEGTIPLKSFERFTELLLGSSGDVQVKLEFRKGKMRKTLVVGQIFTSVSVTCQKCLEPMTIELDLQFRSLIVDSEEALLELDQDVDGFVCPDELLPLAELVEDELLVGIPMVSRHEDGQCSFDMPQQPVEKVVESKGDTHRPFAALAEMKDKLTRS